MHRPRPINPLDLLPRREIITDRAAVSRLLKGKPVLVTGGGGFIGSELVRQCVALGAEVTALDNHELGLFNLGDTCHTVLGDVRDACRMRDVIHEICPAVIFHAAALKHVPLLEDHEREAAKTNIVGTINACTQFTERAGTEVVVLISTDKAVEPASVMGRAKAAAELVIHDADTRKGARCRYTAVRFGNVMGSTGSVIPLFQAQIAAGGPVTVTHAEMYRWFITVNEAVELVLQAAALSLSRPRGEIYVLDMGYEQSILTVAKDMIRLSGVDVPIEITGLRPGERLREKLVWAHETVVGTECSGVWGVSS